MSKSIVLVTGASGHLGFRIVINALESGYHVRAAVRSQARANDILAAESVKKLNPGSSLSFIYITDILAPGAYDTAVKDVTYIIHTASPLAEPSEDDEATIVKPAVAGTLNILEAANKSPSVKRVVITSSVIAVVPWVPFIAEESEKVYTADDVVSDSEASGPYGHYFQAYAASKVKALNATKRFLAESPRHFDNINIMPGFFIGKSELASAKKEDLASGHGTNKTAFAPIMGAKSETPYPGSMADVDDIAKVHVLSLGEHVKGGQNFGIQAGGIDGTPWDDALRTVKKHYPKEVAAGILPANGTQPSKLLRYDVSATEKVLGIKLRSYEEAVVSLVDWYLEELAKTK